MSCKVSFIGLGVMGYPMAGYISKAGHNVTVYNRTKSKAEKWCQEYKGKITETPEEAAKDSDFVFTCVGNDDDLKEVTFGKNGIFKTIDVSEKYVKRNLQNIKFTKKLTIAWDIGNGAVGKVIDKFINNLSDHEHFVINKKVDGNFPNHHPDPTVPKNMLQLIELVQEKKCDIGFAFDGDGDRLGVVDDKGNIIWADQYMILLCKEVASLYKQPKIILDVKCSKIIFDESQ